MLKIKVKVVLSVITEMNPEHYTEEWHRACDKDNLLDAEGNYPEVAHDFAMELFASALEDDPGLIEELTEDMTIDYITELR